MHIGIFLDLGITSNSLLRDNFMSISYQYHKELRYILTKVTKVITLAEVLSYVDSILEDESINAPFYEVVDFVGIKSFDFGYHESHQLYEKLILLKKHKKHMGTCFIASKDLVKGMTNIFKVLGEEKGMNIKTFENMGEVLEYIKNNST